MGVSPSTIRSSASSLLDRYFLRADGLRLFAACIPLSVGVFLLQDLLEIAISWIVAVSGLPSRLEEIQDLQSRRLWFLPLVVAPLVENFVLLLCARLLHPLVGGGRWRLPTVLATLAALVHMADYQEIVYASIFVNFFAMAALIHNVENRSLGFWASVFVHSLTNLLVLIQLRWMFQ